MMNMKQKHLLILGIIVVLGIVLIGIYLQPKQPTFDFEAAKFCNIDSDCASESGCWFGCWNKDKISELPPRRICTATAGPKVCICYENKCQDADPVIEKVAETNLNKSLDLCKTYYTDVLLAYCYRRIAILKKDISICDNLDTENLVDICSEGYR